MRTLRKITIDDTSRTAGFTFTRSKVDRRRGYCSSVASQCGLLLVVITTVAAALYIKGSSSKSVEAPSAVSFNTPANKLGLDEASHRVARQSSPDIGNQTGETVALFPWERILVNRTTCSNTCVGHSSNGICEDGRGGDGRVYCDLGTDCADCGPWTHAVPWSPGELQAASPVADLLGQGVEVYVKQTRTVPPFLMPYTNPKQDVDVSGQMHINGNIELGLTQVWYTRLNGQCVEKGGGSGHPGKGAERSVSGRAGRRLVVDIGANFGYYSLYAAAHGCRSIDNEGAYDFITVKGERVDSIVQEDVLLMKLDVEGFEPTAFQSSKGILDTYNLLKHGFTLLHVRDELVGSSLLDENFQGTLPAFEEILAENLVYDIEDAHKLQSRTMGCTPPTALSDRWPLHWGGCNFIPEDLHPKSFRGYFGHNTNIWAAATPKGINISQPVGVQSLSQNATEWYGRDPEYGVGRRECKYIKPELQVRHRCKCRNQTICGEEARMVEKYALLGELVPNAEPSGPLGEEDFL
ncbi:hypothetical protein COCSUDRAFT_65824 [Coccomyxa subellipsoidea C-169]|uniref:Methyltransferase FkbM domain-containing protein n=1 Tax=Coccomyxa subellipsoidea (strain C-169) TaxID=574566 RepID=I0Z0U8_COCSC|nr:hypothetical protein COCSUDRAFT_65824 [Coccomyxa subellipsoidea C-169]EIE24267.1 hypothetical protein COCSUDRAFT_65824 [Coccomyxa subellipsoidea C-169]|eukprot:XP_005648811.1 hypothetical protein COCSUDRAFT_65824 [Coccomyxa subellipsoidea C-169]